MELTIPYECATLLEQSNSLVLLASHGSSRFGVLDGPNGSIG